MSAPRVVDEVCLKSLIAWAIEGTKRSGSGLKAYLISSLFNPSNMLDLSSIEYRLRDRGSKRRRG
jgi:hypothetical protein